VFDDNNSNKQKLFKDPIYGYISVPFNFIYTFIDTPVFQRLRHIVQTSYSPLYPTALHNRFVHSLGVYHLGSLAFENIENTLRDAKIIKEITSFLIEDYKTLFLVACLLHDLGHAPFSHIGEKFYETTPSKEAFVNQFWEAAGVIETKYKPHDPRKETATPHELMSVIVALRVFESFFKNKDKEFFARCITGYEYNVSQYDEELKYQLQLKNCLISILKSDLIDVDRLDYLIRDSFVSGYQNVSIDYKRLLSNLMVVYDKNEERFILAFHKNAVSIIESVIFAHDSEKKWIQNHPVICYEAEIIKYAIRKVITYFGSNNIFCSEALTEEGVLVNTKPPASVEYKISLLSDTEILFFIKNLISHDEFLNEFFDRTKRRRALWKSEVEFTQLYISKLSGDAIKSLMSICDSIIKVFEGSLLNIPPVINEQALSEAINILHHPDELFYADELVSNIEENRVKAIMNRITKFIEYCKCFKEFAQKNSLNFKKGFLILMLDKFTSNFNKENTDKIRIWFPTVQQTDVFTAVTPTLISTQSEKTKLIYFYIQKINDDNEKRKIQEKFLSFVGNELKAVYD
jgi:HD superfamily phosphohydrolase